MSETNALEQAKSWLARFARALSTKSHDALQSLLADDAEWRDVVAFTWDFSTFSGAGEIAEAIIRRNDDVSMSNIRLAEGRTPPTEVSRAGETVIEAIYEFDTAIGAGAGIVRLLAQADGDARARLFSTLLQEIRGHEERR